MLKLIFPALSLFVILASQAEYTVKTYLIPNSKECNSYYNHNALEVSNCNADFTKCDGYSGVNAPGQATKSSSRFWSFKNLQGNAHLNCTIRENAPKSIVFKVYYHCKGQKFLYKSNDNQVRCVGNIFNESRCVTWTPPSSPNTKVTICFNN